MLEVARQEEHVEARSVEQRSLNEAPDGVLIAIPLYRSPHLLPDLVDSLLGLATEIEEANGTILFINDSPDDAALGPELDRAIGRLRGFVSAEQIGNPRNVGFIQSANHSMELALASDRDLILLNSDALPRPGAFREMLEVAYSDPLIGVVSPRSDNATICNSPVTDRWRGVSRQAAFSAHTALCEYLPRISYVPTAVGFCLYIKRLVLAEFGFLDPGYGAGYHEENDFIRRCNQRGYRAVLANHAFVHHIGSVSFEQTDQSREVRDRDNHALLIRRYPEYDGIVQRYFSDPAFAAERVLSGLLPFDGRLRVLLDCRVLGEFYNGTFEHLRCLVAAFAAMFGDRFDIGVLCEEAAFHFHELGAIPGIAHRDFASALADPAAIAFRLSQPDMDSVTSLAGLGAVVGAFMLDTIAMDCQQIDESGFAAMWQEAADELDMIGFNSAFSRDQFRRRFEMPERMVQFVSSCSTDVRDYRQATSLHRGGNGILLIGNHYPHKHVLETCRALHAAGSTVPIVSFGVAIDEPNVAVSHVAGHVPEEVVERLYLDADIVLFPSHYEGFGLPIMHALARRLPVIARDLPSARAIKAHCPQGANLHLFASTDEMVACAMNAPTWIETVAPVAPISWGTAATELAEAFEEAIARFDYGICRRRQASTITRRRKRELETIVADGRERGALVSALEKSIVFAQEEIDMLRADAAREIARAELEALARAQAENAVDDALKRAERAESESRALCDRFAAVVVSPSASTKTTALWRRGAATISAIFRRSIDIELPAAAADRGRLCLRARGLAGIGLRERLAAWSRMLPLGGALRLDVPLVAVDKQLDPRIFATALLASAGCATRSIEIGRRRIAIYGVRIASDIVSPADGDDTAFLDMTYRTLLGRSPDPAGRQHYLDLLAAGVTRNTVIDAIGSSQERWGKLLLRIAS